MHFVHMTATQKLSGVATFSIVMCHRVANQFRKYYSLLRTVDIVPPPNDVIICNNAMVKGLYQVQYMHVYIMYIITHMKCCE